MIEEGVSEFDPEPGAATAEPEGEDFGYRLSGSSAADAELDGRSNDAGSARLPPRPGKKKSAKNKKKSAASSRRPQVAESPKSRQVLLLVGGAAGLLVLLGVVTVAVFLRFRDNAGEPNAELANAGAADGAAGGAVAGAQQSDFGGLNRRAAPVVFDKPIPGVRADPQPAPDPGQEPMRLEFVAAAPADTDAADERPLPEEAPSGEPPRWQAAPDPAAENEYTIAPDLRFELTSPGEHLGNLNDEINGMPPIQVSPPLFVLGGRSYSRGHMPPIMAAHLGPFLIVPPTWEKFPYAWKLLKRQGSPTKWSGYERIESPQADIPAIDLRTGQPAGAFDWRIPFWLRPVLSPDGATLVGPYHILPPPVQYLPPEPEDEVQKRRSLFVWKRDEHVAPRVLPMSGQVSSIAFADNQRLLVLVESPQRQLEIWDTSEVKRTAVIELPHGLKYPPQADTTKDPLDLQAYPPATPNVLAASPGGKYAAVMSTVGVLFVSLQDAKLLGVVPVDPQGPPADAPSTRKEEYFQNAKFNGAPAECLSLEFLPSGDTLVAAHFLHGSLSGVRYNEIDITNGTIRRQRDFSPGIRGPLVLSPDRRSFAMVDYPPLGNADSETRFYDFDKRDADFERRPYSILRFPAEGPLLVVRQPGDRRPDPPDVPTVLSVDRQSYLEEFEPLLAVDDLGLRKRPPAAVADRSGVQVRRAVPPPAWKAISSYTVPPPPPATSLGAVSWPVAFGGNRALTVVELERQASAKGHYHSPIAASLLDLSAGSEAVAGPQFELLAYGYRPDQNTSDFHVTTRSGLPAGITVEGDRFAFGDTDQRGRVEVWSTEGHREFAFFTSAQPRSRIAWVDFAPDGQLLTLADGTLSGWRLDETSAQGTFSTFGDYRLPMFFSPDRSLLIASRGKSFDVLNPATGECLGHCAAGGTGIVVDAAFCPDGRQAAVLYEANEYLADKKVRRVPVTAYSPGVSTTQVAIWDLETGTAKLADTGHTGFWQVAWFGPEHLALSVSGSVMVFDLKLGEHVFGCASSALEKTPDGRLRYSERWQLPSLCGSRTAEDELFFAADRSMFALQSMPIRVEIDVGDASLATTHSRKALEALQRQGWTIGPGGGLLKVTMTVEDTGTEMEFEVGLRINVPLVVYAWRLYDSEGREVFTSHSTGHFAARQSKYVTTPDLETRRRMGADSYYDFGGRNPRTAIIEEILEIGRGLDAPPTFPQKLFASGGKFVTIPVAREWQPSP
jgi:WD40 repeat protein